MKSIKQLAEKNDLKNVITAFIKLIGLAKLSKKVNFKRKSVVSLTAVVSWLLATKFARHSLYRAQAAKEFTIRTARNVLNDGRINWQRLLCLAAKQLIARLKPVIDRRRRLALIVDDTLMSRSCSQKTELLAKVYDHNLQKFLTGYRGLTLGWSDANTFLPVNFALMSTGKPHNLVGHPAVSNDQRSVAGKRRCQAQRPM
ncbi:transposase, partial [Lactobacillus acetotolerans]